MADYYFDVFKQPADHNNWNKQREYALKYEEIGKDWQQKLAHSYEFMRDELGSNFLKIKNQNNPIKQMVSNKALWQIKEFVGFTDAMRILKKSDSNYKKLIRALKSDIKAKAEGVPFVEITKAFSKQGLLVHFVDETNKRTPDIEITNSENGEKFYIEVSSLDDSDARKEARHNYNFIFHHILDVSPFCLFAAKHKKAIERKNYPTIAEVILREKLRCLNEREIIAYSDEYVEFLLAPEEMKEGFQEQCDMQGLRANHLEGLELNFDEASRLISSKIGLKAKQIPTGSNGLLYFPVSPLFFIGSSIIKAKEKINSYLTRFPNVMGVVMASKILNDVDPVITGDGTYFYTRKVDDGLCREMLFIANPGCELQIGEDTLIKMFKAVTLD